MPETLCNALERLRSDWHVCKDATGSPWHPNALTRAYERWQKALPEGLKRVPLKNLRHTHLTLAIDAGADLIAVSRRAGHSNVGITSAYYLRPHEEVDKRVSDLFDCLMKE